MTLLIHPTRSRATVREIHAAVDRRVEVWKRERERNGAAWMDTPASVDAVRSGWVQRTNLRESVRIADYATVAALLRFLGPAEKESVSSPAAVPLTFLDSLRVEGGTRAHGAARVRQTVAAVAFDRRFRADDPEAYASRGLVRGVALSLLLWALALGALGWWPQ